MFDKSFDEMRKIDVSQYVEKRDGADYLNWAKCIQLLHDNGAEKVYFEPLVDERTGSTLFHSDLAFTNKLNNINKCYEVRVRIVIDDKFDFVYNYPLINGANAVCDNSLSQLRVASAQARAFVKGVAIHTGLGFDLWLKEDEFKEDAKPVVPEALLELKKMFGEEYSRLHNGQHISGDEVAKKIGLTDFDALKGRMSMFDELYSLLTKLKSL